jgi:hypothetical protein
METPPDRTDAAHQTLRLPLSSHEL